MKRNCFLVLLSIMLFLSSQSLAADLITPDGIPGDWKFAQTVITDPPGNSKCGDRGDIKRICTSIDNNYAYIMVETYTKPIDPDLVIEMDFDFQPGWRHWPVRSDDLHTNIRGPVVGGPVVIGWTGNHYDKNFVGAPVPGCTVVWGEVCEIRIPLSALGNPKYFRATYADTWTSSGRTPCNPIDIAPRFNVADLYSENRSYDPLRFQFEESSPFSGGKSYWFMAARATVPVDSNYHVLLDSDITGKMKMASYFRDRGNYHPSPMNNYSHLFFDISHPMFGGPYPNPGPAWEDRTYTFSVEEVKSDWYIPNGSLQKLPVPEVTISGTNHPTISWNPVPGADDYTVVFFPLDGKGDVDLSRILAYFKTQELSFTYDGDTFENGAERAISVMASQKHPDWQNSRYRYGGINISSFFTKHSATKLPKDKSPPCGSVHAYDNSLWPPNNQLVDVTVSGYIKDEISVSRDGTGVGVSSAYMIIDGNTFVLRDQTTDLIDLNGRFSFPLKVVARKGAVYNIELYAADTNPDSEGGPNSGLIDSTVIRVAK